jgi:hypothetical protein
MVMTITSTTGLRASPRWPGAAGDSRTLGRDRHAVVAELLYGGQNGRSLEQIEGDLVDGAALKRLEPDENECRESIDPRRLARQPGVTHVVS